MAFMTASQLSQQYQSVLKPANKPEHEVSQVTSTDDKYEVKLSINQFEPEELTVKVIDRYIHIEGRHEEKNDKIGFFTRQFTRRYFLPEGVQPEAIRCTFCVDTSMLTVSAPIISKKPVKELTIPIIVVGQQLHHPKNDHKHSKHEKDLHKQKHASEKHEKHQHSEKRNNEKFEKEKHSSAIHQPQPLYSQPIKHHHHHSHSQHHHHQQHYKEQQFSSSTLPPPPPPHATAVTSSSNTLPPPATASTSSGSRKHHHHHHYHPQDFPPSQMNF